MTQPDTNSRNQYSYAAYFGGVCKAIASADPDFLTHSSVYIAKWKKAGAEVRLIKSEQAITDIGQFYESLKTQGASQGKLL